MTAANESDILHTVKWRADWICKMLAITRSWFRIFYFAADYKNTYNFSFSLMWFIPNLMLCLNYRTLIAVSEFRLLRRFLVLSGRKWLMEEENCKVRRLVIYFLCSVIIRSRIVRWARDVACMEAWPMNAKFSVCECQGKSRAVLFGCSGILFWPVEPGVLSDWLRDQ